jgi:predicted ribosome quality control (RQC) complex YloA/Tae2 family protein
MKELDLRGWTVSELDNVVGALQALEGTRLQEVITSKDNVVFGFYSSHSSSLNDTGGQMLWLWLDLNVIRPTLLPWVELPFKPASQKTPLQLFMRAHFVGRSLRQVERNTEFGRVVTLKFGAPEDRMEVQIRLFPHGRNVLLQAGEKKLAWQKPKELLPTEANEKDLGPTRSLEELRDEWKIWRYKPQKKGGSAVKPSQGLEILEKEMKKKRAAREKVIQELEQKRGQPWREVGEWLKHNQTVDVPSEWEPFVDRRRKLAWNIEQCFTKAREIDGKIHGTEKRLEILEGEIEKLQIRLFSPETANRPEPQKSAPVIKSDAQRRTLKLSDQLTVAMGKSAADNMKLLRQARAWDLWMHLKDYPSSHAIVFRNKGTKVSDSELFKIADWFIRQQLGLKFAKHAGEKFALVVTECRHVHPIRGDKIGRVTYRDERLLIYALPG